MTAHEIRSTLGSVRRTGPWTVPQQLDVHLLWADAELDFREAKLPPGVTTIEVTVTMASLAIVVPPGLPVDVQVVPFAGSVETHPTSLIAHPAERPSSGQPATELDAIRAALDEDAGLSDLDVSGHPYRSAPARDEASPSLLIIGSVRFANVEVTTRLPGESAREARRREKQRCA